MRSAVKRVVCTTGPFSLLTPPPASSDLTLRQTRRLLETDLQLPQNALDDEPHKSLIKHQVDEACGLSALNCLRL